MIRLFLSLVLFLLSGVVSRLNAQYSLAIYDIRHGSWQSDLSKLNEGLTNSSLKKLNNVNPVLGFSLFERTPFLFGARGSANFHLDYDYFLPQGARLNNTISTTLTGFGLGLGLGKNFLLIKKKFELLVTLGFNTGRFKLLWTNTATTENNSVYRDPYFSPRVLIQPRIIFPYVTLSGKAGYQYDISRGGWKYTDKSLSPIGNAYMSGYILEVCLGFYFHPLLGN